MPNDTLKTASVLAFERKLDPSDALMYSGSWAGRDNNSAWMPVKLREKSVRGTISNRLKTKDQDPAKLHAAIENPNLQTVDVAALPAGADTLKLEFTLRVLGGVGEPSACNNEAYRSKLLETVASYKDQQGLQELAKRYAANLANGRFLWRNRIGAEQVQVDVAHIKGGESAASWSFNALEHNMRSLEAGDADSAQVSELAALIESGLSGKAHILLKVSSFVRLGEGQEVFPSQELILDRGRGDKSRTLYAVGDDDRAVAAIHSQKIGNAIRTIDTWYPDSENMGAIAVEPYGSVTTQGAAYRQPKAKQDFYTLLDGWITKDKAPEVGNQHFVMAVLIRGGVFGEAG